MTALRLLHQIHLAHDARGGMDNEWSAEPLRFGADGGDAEFFA